MFQEPVNFIQQQLTIFVMRHCTELFTCIISHLDSVLRKCKMQSTNLYFEHLLCAMVPILIGEIDKNKEAANKIFIVM